MESADFMYTRRRSNAQTEGKKTILDYNDIQSLLGNNIRRTCPKCGRTMQKSGQKADSNGVIKQRFLCPSCKRKGRTPYNYFFVI